MYQTSQSNRHNLRCGMIAADGTLRAGYVEVVITWNENRLFSGIWGTSKVPVKARAVARGQWLPSPNGVNGTGVMALDPTASGSLAPNGNGNMTVTNGSII